jgi:hypothetical protein
LLEQYLGLSRTITDPLSIKLFNADTLLHEAGREKFVANLAGDLVPRPVIVTACPGGRLRSGVLAARLSESGFDVVSQHGTDYANLENRIGNPGSLLTPGGLYIPFYGRCLNSFVIAKESDETYLEQLQSLLVRLAGKVGQYPVPNINVRIIIGHEFNYALWCGPATRGYGINRMLFGTQS